MRRPLALLVLVVALLLACGATTAFADPVRSPRISFGTVVCGNVTYHVVSPDNAPVGQALTANGSNSTSVQIMIVDKAGSRFPQNLLTVCTAYPPDEPPFTSYVLITPVG